jgi:hypothetical protein
MLRLNPGLLRRWHSTVRRSCHSNEICSCYKIVQTDATFYRYRWRKPSLTDSTASSRRREITNILPFKRYEHPHSGTYTTSVVDLDRIWFQLHQPGGGGGGGLQLKKKKLNFFFFYFLWILGCKVNYFLN